jgi:hypothetical protein
MGWRSVHGIGDFALPAASLFCPCTSSGIYEQSCYTDPAPTGDAARACAALASVGASAAPPAGTVPLPGGLPYAGYESSYITMCKDPAATVPAALVSSPLKNAPTCPAGSPACSSLYQCAGSSTSAGCFNPLSALFGAGDFCLGPIGIVEAGIAIVLVLMMLPKGGR